MPTLFQDITDTIYKNKFKLSVQTTIAMLTDGSHAFARYREIDMDIKRELVEIIYISTTKEI